LANFDVKVKPASNSGIIGQFSRFKSRRGKQAEAENNAENDDGGARGNCEGREGDVNNLDV